MDNNDFNKDQFNNQYSDTNPYDSQYTNTQYADNQYANNQYTNNQYTNNQYANNQYANNQYANNQYPNNQYPQQDFDYTPISMWGYFGYQLLFAIPLVGLIILIIFSFGGTNNINLRNFARSYFCFAIIGIAITIIMFAITAAVGAGTSLYYY